MFGHGHDDSIVQRGVNAVRACQDLVEAAPTQATPRERLIARIASLSWPLDAALPRPPVDRSRGHEGISPRTVQCVRLGSLLTTATTLALAYVLHAGFRVEAGRALSVLFGGDGAAIGDYLLSYGVWAPIASLCLMVVQAIAAPVPAILVAFANGLAFGVIGGGLLTLAGQTLAAVICFWIARALGRAPVEALAGKVGLATADRWFARHGARGVFLTRLIPGISFDVISYAAGLTGIGFGSFVVATVIGVAPQAFLYAFLIRNSPQYAWAFYAVTWGAVAIITAITIARGWRTTGGRPLAVLKGL